MWSLLGGCLGSFSLATLPSLGALSHTAQRMHVWLCSCARAHTHSVLLSSQVTCTLGFLVESHLPPLRGVLDCIHHNLKTTVGGNWREQNTDLVLVSLPETSSPKARFLKTNLLKTCLLKVNDLMTNLPKAQFVFWCVYIHLGVLFFFVLLWIFQGFISIHPRVLLSYYQQHKFIKFAALCNDEIASYLYGCLFLCYLPFKNFLKKFKVSSNKYNWYRHFVYHFFCFLIQYSFTN